jgi:hypothetical protein
MSKPRCLDKVSYFSAEEATACALPGLKIYQCPHCHNFHSTSQKKRPRHVKRHTTDGSRWLSH